MADRSGGEVRTLSIFVRIFLAAAATVLLGGCGSHPPVSEMSVILVTLDTTRADRLGAYGGTAVRTPHLDAVAREGILFETAVSQVPLTLPAHGTILTGLHPAAHGVRHNGIYRLPEEVVTVTERFRDKGFDTAAFIGAYVLNRGFGTEQGFRTYDDVPVNRFRGGRDRLFEAERSADQVNERVFRWLDGERGERIFLWVHYYDPHEPYAPPEEGRDLEGEGYDREISYLDACFGDLVRRLREDGWLDRSLLVVVGDHGESLGEHGEPTHGLFLYEGAVRVPFLLRAPVLLPEGRRVEGPVGLVDVAPTVLDLLEMPPLDDCGGRSLVPMIRGDEDGTTGLVFAETWMPRLEFGWSELYMVRSHRYKYIEAPHRELYDLLDDPEESLNLEGSDAARAEEMAGWLREWTGGASGEIPEPSRDLGPEEEARLRALGYLGGDAFRDGAAAEGNGGLPDPKDMIQEMVRLDEARAKLAAGDPDGAMEGVEPILRENPHNYWARRTKIGALVELGRLREAEEEARAGITLLALAPGSSGPQEARILGLLAGALHLQGKHGEAEEAYRRVLELDPGEENAAVDLSRLLIETGRPEEALEITGGVLARSPGNGMALASRFLAETELGRNGEALGTAVALADAGTGDPPVLVNAGNLLAGAGEHARAAACYRAAMDQTGADPVLLGKLGTSLMSAGDHAAAREAFTTAAAMTPNDPRPPFYLGEIALAAGEVVVAREWFERATRINPRFTAPRVSLARWHAGRGEREEARALLSEALRSNPNDATARQLLRELSADR
jgi:arylsulfatase A-like enzyme/Flp pilus assembly protein TadD